VRVKFAAYRDSCIGCVAARGLVLMRRSRAGAAAVLIALQSGRWFLGATSPVSERVQYFWAKIEAEKIRDGEVVWWAVA
jgi:hypothetical protein